MTDMAVDTSFDVRTDAGGKDPDSHSKTLRRYHQVLWSKPLPDGTPFELDRRLHHVSSRGEFWLASDAITHTYVNWSRPARLVEVIRQAPPADVQAFYDLGCTVGAYTVFPSMIHVEGKWRHSINQSRGIHPKIKDRFDLTLECIRRLYLDEPSPMSIALGWHRDFFDLFGDFAGYVDHFLLNDLVTADYSTVQFWTDFDDFARDALPAKSLSEYREYIARSMQFITNRYARIAQLVPTPSGRLAEVESSSVVYNGPG